MKTYVTFSQICKLQFSCDLNVQISSYKIFSSFLISVMHRFSITQSHIKVAYENNSCLVQKYAGNFIEKNVQNFAYCKKRENLI